MKKIGIGILVIITLILLHLSVRFVINEAYIYKSNKGYYDSSLVDKLFIINYPQSYVAYFNRGNNKYHLEDYKGALEDYEEALKRVNKKNVCKVRNNIVLTKMKLYQYKSDDSKDCLKDIEDLQKILLEDECAKEDGSGKNENSQTIYNELEELKKSCNSGGGGSSGGGDDPDDPQGGQGEDPKEQEIEQKIKEQQKQTQKEREEGKKPPYDYYRGKKW